MHISSIRKKRLLPKILILVVLAFLVDASWIFHRANTIPLVYTSGSQPHNSHYDSIGRNKDVKQKQRVYIAGTHWNSEEILRSHWNGALLELVRSLGPENVYVSIVESGSWDGTKQALRELDYMLEQLGVRRTISLDETTHVDEISDEPEANQEKEGWIYTPRGRQELRRIPFLSRQRNLSLKPLVSPENSWMKFDKILFLNDVVFTTEDFYTLLNTNQGFYAAACALDFSIPPRFYDTFAVRDIDGHEPMMKTWPYFRSSKSRQALERGEATPVQSCWNSMVIMEASPFYDISAPLLFRGIEDDLAKYHLESSECCLIHTDNPLSAQNGVWINPNVRVGYDGASYEYVHSAWPYSHKSDLWMRIWENRLLRWLTTDKFKRWWISRRMRQWQTTTKMTKEEIEREKICLTTEMQVLTADGWTHT